MSSYGIADMADFVQRQIDRIMPADSRHRAYSTTKSFAAERPLLFSFMVAQASFTLMPILFFLTFASSVLFVVAAGSLVFSLFWIGIALTVLIPVLAVTSSIALFTWAFSVAAYGAGRWVYSAFKQLAPGGTLDLEPPVVVNGRSGATTPAASPSSPSDPTPAASSSSSSGASGASGAQVKSQDSKPEEEEGPSAVVRAPAHPEPGSDVDALEP